MYLLFSLDISAVWYHADPVALLAYMFELSALSAAFLLVICEWIVM